MRRSQSFPIPGSRRFSGETYLDRLQYRNTQTGEVTEYRPAEGDTFGVFVFAGYEPATELVKGLAELDDPGLYRHRPEPEDKL